MEHKKTKVKKMAKSQLVLEIFKPDEKGVSEWKTREELDWTPLKLTGNGNSRDGAFFGDKTYVWETKRYNGAKTGKVLELRTNGFSDYSRNKLRNRTIRKDIRKQLLIEQPCCCVCGTSSNLEIDHKNDLYNEDSVFTSETQKIEDFQVLCKHCNDVKRQVCKNTFTEKKRMGASKIPMLEALDVDFTEGGETFDKTDEDGMKGTFWYDPIDFVRKVVSRWKNEITFLRSEVQSLQSANSQLTRELALLRAENAKLTLKSIQETK
jgi:hypothetical protein